MNDSLTSFYFPHDYNARNDERLLMLRSEHGLESYAVFWMILESMASASTGEINRVAIGGLSIGYGVAKDRLTAIIDYCITIGLFKERQDGAIYSTRMKAHLAHRQVLKDAGKRGAEKRWSQSQKNSHPNAKERREEERKGKKNESIVVAPSAPTPSQESRLFFDSDEYRQSIITKLVEAGASNDFVRAEVKKFCYYWTERNKSGTKQRWETEKTFEVRRRLTTWLNRSTSTFPKKP